MANFMLRNPSGVAVLSISGELTIRVASEARKALLRAMDKSMVIEIDLKKVTCVDFTFLQILCSAHHTANRLNKQLTFSRPFPRPLSEAAETAGFFRHTGCNQDSDRDCLWLGDADD